MSLRQTHLILIVFLLATSLGMMGWSYWPQPAEQNRIFIKPENMTLPGPSDPQPAVLEFRTLTTLWPRSVRLGDSGLVRLDFALDPVTRDGVDVQQLPSVYDTYNVLIEARLEMPAATVAPPGLSSQPLRPGQDVSFQWRVYPVATGLTDGTIWLYLRFVPRENGEQEQLLVAVKQVSVEAFSFLGLQARTVRIIGGVGMLLGFILALPFLDSLLRYLWGKSKGNR